MPDVLLATFALVPDGEPGGDLVHALGQRGITAAWARWDDPDVDWTAAHLVAVRSTWDYHRRYPDFLAWAQARNATTPMLNGPEVFAWNADKSYLCEVAERVPTVPTRLLDDATLVEGLSAALSDWGTVVVKPRTGAGGVGVVLVDHIADERLEGLVAGPWIVQPLVDSVRIDGETSVFVFGGRAVTQVDKRPAAGEIRVHELYGGSSRSAPLAAERRDLAESAVEVAAELSGATIHYARVDLMRWDDRWAVSELELIEPGLYLDVEPANAEHFAELVRAVLDR